MKPLVLIGGGGHCRSVIEAAESCGRMIYGIIDTPDKIGDNVLGYKIIDSDDNLSRYIPDYEFIITIGQISNTDIRRRISDKIATLGGVMGIVTASTANISRFASIGAGTVILHGAMINAGAGTGVNCIVNTLANIDHDTLVGDFCHISTGVMVNGGCVIGNDVFIGSGSVIAHGISVAGGSIVAAGTVLKNSAKEKGLYAGNPGQIKKYYE